MKPNCYECKWRAGADGSGHSKCVHPKVNDEGIALLLAVAGLTHPDMNVTGSAYGIEKGWFLWPTNFDPVWLETCGGFEKKGGEEVDMKDAKVGDLSNSVSPAISLPVSPTNATNA